jgi:hypothetical protein
MACAQSLLDFRSLLYAGAHSHVAGGQYLALIVPLILPLFSQLLAE